VNAIRRTLFASAYHLPPEDRRRLPTLALLRMGEPWLSVLDAGAMIRVPSDAARLGEYCAMAERIGFSRHFRRLLQRAQQDRCQYLHIDTTAPALPGMELFDGSAHPAWATEHGAGRCPP